MGKLPFQQVPLAKLLEQLSPRVWQERNCHHFHFASLGLLLPLASALLAGMVPSQGCEVAPGCRSVCGRLAPLRTMWVNLGSYVLTKNWKNTHFFPFYVMREYRFVYVVFSGAITMPVTVFSFFKFVNWHPLISGIAVVKCYFSGRYWGMCVSLFWQWIDRWFIFPTWPKV